MQTRNSDMKQEMLDGNEVTRINPFYCYCKTVHGCTPEDIPLKDRIKYYNSFQKLGDNYKKYYSEMASSLCGTNWDDDFFISKNNVIIPKNKAHKTTEGMWMPLSNVITKPLNKIQNLEDLITTLENSILLTAKSSCLDCNMWSHYPPKSRK